MKIKSYWSCEKGRWDNEKNTFVDITWSLVEEKMLDVVITKDKKPIIKFLGGPTGHEAYYLESLMRDSENKEGKLYICAGTINRWYSCWVLWEDLKELLRDRGYYA